MVVKPRVARGVRGQLAPGCRVMERDAISLAALHEDNRPIRAELSHDQALLLAADAPTFAGLQLEDAHPRPGRARSSPLPLTVGHCRLAWTQLAQNNTPPVGAERQRADQSLDPLQPRP